MKKLIAVLFVCASFLNFSSPLEGRHLEVSQSSLIRQASEFDSNFWVYLVHQVLRANQNLGEERVIGFLNKNQFPLFSDAEQKVAFSLVLEKPSLLMDFMSLKDNRGDHYVPHLVALTRFMVDSEKTSEEAVKDLEKKVKNQFAVMQKLIASTPYGFRDAFYLKKYHVDISELVDYEHFAHAREAAFAYHLGREDGHIEWDPSSSKPKALILAGEDDPNEAFAPTPAYVKFISEIQEHYNVRYQVVGTPEEFCEEIERASKEGNIELLVVGGHGSQHTIRLGRNSRLFSDRKLPDEDILKKLAPKATIFLESCATGDGKDEALNMANYFAAHAPGRTVIAPIVPLTIFNEKLSFTPKFNVSLIDDDGRDISYRIEPDPKTRTCPSNGSTMCKN